MAIEPPYFNDTVEFAPVLCRFDGLYCVSFYAKADRDGASVASWIRGVHFSENSRAADYPGIRVGEPLTTEWRRYAFFFVANRLPVDPTIANSYLLSIQARNCRNFWIDGVQIEEVEARKGVAASGNLKQANPHHVPGYPTAFRLAGPVEACAETINAPEHQLFSEKQNSAEIQVSIANGSEARRIVVSLELFDHRHRSLGPIARDERDLRAEENWRWTARTILTHNGAMIAHAEVRDARTGSLLQTSDEPLTRLPFENDAIGEQAAERFGVNLSFTRPHVPDSENAGLAMLRRVGFRWVRVVSLDWPEVEKQAGGRDWRAGDEDIDFAVLHGFRRLVTIANHPHWAGGGRLPNVSTNDMDWSANDPRWDDLTVSTAFDAYLHDLASRYRGRVDVYQLGNETTAPGMSATDPALVFRRCRRAAQILKRADPGAKFLGGNILYDNSIGFWAAVARLGGLDDMDYFGWDFDCYTEDGTDAPTIATLKDSLQQNGGKTRPLFNYESGWSSGRMQDGVADVLGGALVDYAEIPDAMARSLVAAFAGGTEHFLLHLAAYPENLMGSYSCWSRWPTQLYDEQERPRVTLAAYNTLIHYLGLSKPLGRVSRPEWGLEGYAFQDLRKDRPIVAYWASRSLPEGQAIPLFVKARLVVSDVMGSETPVVERGVSHSPFIMQAHRGVTFLIGDPGTTARPLLEAFQALPARALYRPMFAGGEGEGRDDLQGRWRVGFARSAGLILGDGFRETRPTSSGDTWHPTGSDHAWLVIRDRGTQVEIGGHGPTGAPGYDQAGMLLFSPPRAGRFALRGEARVSGGESNDVRVFVGAVRNGQKYQPIFTRDQSGGIIDLSAASRDAAISLAPGDWLAIGAYRTAWHWYGGATFTGLEVEPK